MEFEEAKNIVDSIRSIDSNFNEIFYLIEEIDNEALKKKFRFQAASIVSRMYGEIILPLEIKFPKLIAITEKDNNI